MNRKLFCLLVVFFGGILVQPVQAGIYLKVSDTGSFSLTNKPSDRAFELIAGSRSRQEMDRTDVAVERASGVHGIPESLIFAIIKNNDRESGGLMGLSSEYRETLTDTEVETIPRNVMLGTKHFRQLLTHYQGNLTLALGAFYAGKKAVEEAGGLPTESARQFVNNVREAFSKLETRQEIFYTYRNSRGVLTVVNIRP